MKSKSYGASIAFVFLIVLSNTLSIFALTVAARDYLKAMRIRRLVQLALRQLLTDIDVLVSPSRLTVAC